MTQYIKEKHKYLCRCNAFERAQQLIQPGERHRYAERLDRDMVQASLVAERRIQQVGEPAWSVAFDQARKRRVTILKKSLTMARTRLDLTQIVQTANAAMTEQINLPTTRGGVVYNYDKRNESSRKLWRQKSFQQRDKERKQKILELELSGSVRKTAQARLLRKLRRAEEIKTMMATIRAARTSGSRHGVTSIEIPVQHDPKTCTEWQVIDVPTEVVEQLKHRNLAHFGQAHGTPFRVPPLASDLDFCADGPGGAAILSGSTYDTST